MSDSRERVAGDLAAHLRFLSENGIQLLWQVLAAIISGGLLGQ